MKGIWFGDIHSYDNLNLVLSKVELPPATPKTNFIDIPGGDGSVDLTEAPGEVKYKDRVCSFTFTVFPSDDFEEKKKEVSNLLNGKRCRIILDKDPNYYWIGRCEINEYASNKNLHQIVIGATVAPYKYKHDETRVFVPLSGKNLFDYNNFDVLIEMGSTLSVIDGGIRATWQSGKHSSTVLKLFPINALVGRTITLSLKVQASANNKPIYYLGYASSNGQDRRAKVSRTTSGAISMTVEETNGCDWVVLWLYGSSGVEESNLTVGDYVDYTNIQLEIGNTATTYEPYTIVSPKDVILTNSRKTTCPTILCTDNIEVTVGNGVYNLSAGTHKVLNIQLFEGDTPVSLVGTGAVSFNYQEGDL